jgi:thiol-disulfide isomerase/thioredoxin
MRDLRLNGPRHRWLVPATLGFILAACGTEPDPAELDRTSERNSGAAAAVTAGTAAATELRALPLDIDSLDAGQFGAVLEANRGQVLLVNLWATWCAPCLREIPDLLELETKLGEQGFRLLGISLDDPGSEALIREFRDEWFPEFKTFYTANEDWYQLIGVLDTNWSSILPTSFVLDREGAVVETLTGGRDYAAFEAAVSPHL